MNQKYVSCLQRVFFVIGIFLLLSYAMAMGAEVFRHFYFADKPEFLPLKGASFLPFLQNLFRTLGQAFFAFLMSAVFSMAFHRAPVRSQRANRLMRVSCVGFVGESLLGVVNWLVSLGRLFELGSWSDWLQWLMAAAWSLNLFSSLIGFVYAGSIYVLYRHFSEMVAFESEVV